MRRSGARGRVETQQPGNGGRGGGEQGVTRQHRNRRYLEVPPVRVEQPREGGLGVGHAGHEQLPDAETNTDSRSGGARAGLGCEAQGPCTRLARAADGDLADPGPWRNRGLRFEASAAPPTGVPSTHHPPGGAQNTAPHRTAPPRRNAYPRSLGPALSCVSPDSWAEALSPGGLDWEVGFQEAKPRKGGDEDGA